jgi:hypothetical protein
MNKTFAELTFQSASHVAPVVAQAAEAIVRAQKKVIASIVGQERRVPQCAISVEHNVSQMTVCPVRCAGSLARYRHHLRLQHRPQHRLQHHLQHPAHKIALVVRMLHALVCARLIQQRTSRLACTNAKDVVMTSLGKSSDDSFSEMHVCTFAKSDATISP